MGKEKLLGVFARKRLRTAVERAVNIDREYRCALKKQDMEFKKLEGMGLSAEQYKIVDRVVLTTNYCGAVYGSVAYAQGLRDGIRLMSELSKIK